MENKPGIFESSIKRFTKESYKWFVKTFYNSVYSVSMYRRDAFSKNRMSELLNDEETLNKIAVVELKNDIDNFLEIAYKKEGTDGQIETDPKWIAEHISKGFKIGTAPIRVTPEEAKKIGMTPYDEMRKKLYDIAGFEYTSKEELMRMYKESGTTSPKDIPDKLKKLFNKNGLTLNYAGEMELNPERKTSALQVADEFGLEKFNKIFEEYYPNIANTHAKRKIIILKRLSKQIS